MGPHLRAPSSWQHHYRYQVITPYEADSWRAAQITVPTHFPSADHAGAAGARGTKEHCDTLFRDATRVRQMTRADLTEEVYRAIGMPLKESDLIVRAIFDSVVRALRSGDKVEIRGFGSFHTRQRRARIGRNPKTGARVQVPTKKIPFFKPSKELRELVESIGNTE